MTKHAKSLLMAPFHVSPPMGMNAIANADAGSLLNSHSPLPVSPGGASLPSPVACHAGFEKWFSIPHSWMLRNGIPALLSLIGQQPINFGEDAGCFAIAPVQQGWGSFWPSGPSLYLPPPPTGQLWQVGKTWVSPQKS